ncbi:Pectate lyase [Psidium guajava]|nr:Pectate lyase [Psidium guajava]
MNANRRDFSVLRAADAVRAADILVADIFRAATSSECGGATSALRLVMGGLKRGEKSRRYCKSLIATFCSQLEGAQDER